MAFGRFAPVFVTMWMLSFGAPAHADSDECIATEGFGCTFHCHAGAYVGLEVTGAPTSQGSVNCGTVALTCFAGAGGFCNVAETTLTAGDGRCTHTGSGSTRCLSWGPPT